MTVKGFRLSAMFSFRGIKVKFLSQLHLFSLWLMLEQFMEYINPGQLTCLPVFLHAVAAVIELCEGGGQLVEVIAQRVKQQVICDLLQDFGEAQDAFPKLPFPLVIQQDLRGLGCFTQSVLLDVGQSGYRSKGEWRRCVTRHIACQRDIRKTTGFGVLVFKYWNTIIIIRIDKISRMHISLFSINQFMFTLCVCGNEC